MPLSSLACLPTPPNENKNGHKNDDDIIDAETSSLAFGWKNDNSKESNNSNTTSRQKEIQLRAVDPAVESTLCSKYVHFDAAIYYCAVGASKQENDDNEEAVKEEVSNVCYVDAGGPLLGSRSSSSVSGIKNDGRRRWFVYNIQSFITGHVNSTCALSYPSYFTRKNSFNSSFFECTNYASLSPSPTPLTIPLFVTH